MNKEMLFTIGQMAKLCRTTKDTLYFYERKGLIKPYFIDDNGYRYYDAKNFYTLDMIASLREAGSSVKEICEFMSQITPEKYVDHLTHKCSYIEQKRAELNLLEERITQSILLTKSGLNIKTAEPFIKEEEQQYLIVKPTEDQNDPRYYLGTFSKVLIACAKYGVPYDFHISALITYDKLMENNYNADYFYAISPYKIKGDDVLIRPAGRYISYIHSGPYEQLKCSYTVMMDYIKKNNLTISGNSYEQTLIGWLNCPDENEYKTLISIKLE